MWVTAVGDSSDGSGRKALLQVAKTVSLHWRWQGRLSLGVAGRLHGYVMLPAEQPGVVDESLLLWGSQVWAWQTVSELALGRPPLSRH